MTIEDLVKATGAPSVEALELEMEALGVTVDELAASQSYQESLKADFTQASALTTTQASTPVKAKRGRKALKVTTAEETAATNKAGEREMSAIAKVTNAKQIEQFEQLATQLVGDADKTSEAIAGLVLNYPGLVNRMAAAKINEGLIDASPGFCWADQTPNLSDRLQAIKESYGETA